MWEQILRNINLYYRKSEFSNLEDKKIKESQFTAKELDSLSKLAKHQYYDAYDFTGTSAFDEFESPMDDFFICKTEYGYFLVKTEGYNYCRYIIPLDDNLSKKILNKYNKFFESRKNKMKLTNKERQLVKEYANKLISRRLNESIMDSEEALQLTKKWVRLVQSHSPKENPDIIGKKLMQVGILDINDDYDPSLTNDIKYHFLDGKLANKTRFGDSVKYLQDNL